MTNLRPVLATLNPTVYPHSTLPARQPLRYLCAPGPLHLEKCSLAGSTGTLPMVRIPPSFQGCLSLCVHAETLKQYFEQFGKVDACTIMRDAAGRSRCFAFLTFEDPASVNAVMVREHFLDGKVVRTVFLSIPLDHISLIGGARSIRSARSHERSISARRSSSSAGWREASRPRACANSSLSLAVSLTALSCLTVRQAGRRASGSSHSKMWTLARYSVSETWRLMGSW